MILYHDRVRAVSSREKPHLSILSGFGNKAFNEKHQSSSADTIIEYLGQFPTWRIFRKDVLCSTLSLAETDVASSRGADCAGMIDIFSKRTIGDERTVFLDGR